MEALDVAQDLPKLVRGPVSGDRPDAPAQGDTPFHGAYICADGRPCGAQVRCQRNGEMLQDGGPGAGRHALFREDVARVLVRAPVEVADCREPRDRVRFPGADEPGCPRSCEISEGSGIMSIGWVEPMKCRAKISRQTAEASDAQDVRDRRSALTFHRPGMWRKVGNTRALAAACHVCRTVRLRTAALPRCEESALTPA